MASIMYVYEFNVYSIVRFPIYYPSECNELNNYTFYIKVPHSAYIYKDTYTEYKEYICELYEKLLHEKGTGFETMEDNQERIEIVYYNTNDNSYHDGEDILISHNIDINDGDISDISHMEWQDHIE